MTEYRLETPFQHGNMVYYYTRIALALTMATIVRYADTWGAEESPFNATDIARSQLTRTHSSGYLLAGVNVSRPSHVCGACIIPHSRTPGNARNTQYCMVIAKTPLEP